MIALGGHAPEDPSDPLWLVPPIGDVPVLTGDVTQDRIEDLQLHGFLSAVAAAGGRHPLEVLVPATDPPDRILRSIGHEWRLELTELTLQDVRAELAPIRAAGRILQEALRAAADDYKHLRGRLVMIAPIGQELPRDPSADLSAVLEVLKEDRGALSDLQLDYSQGLPEELPQAGFYGDVGVFNVHVNGPPGVPGEITVAASTQAQIKQSAALEALEARVRAKDKPANELLLISCGLPDKRGYICSVDTWIFQLLAELHLGGASLVKTEPEYLSAVVLHNFADGRWFGVLQREGSDLPWSPA